MNHAPLPPEAEQALAEGRKIEAIKCVREAEGLDLKAAKERVEAVQRTNPERYPQAQGGGGNLLWVIIAIVLIWMLWRWWGG